VRSVATEVPDNIGERGQASLTVAATLRGAVLNGELSAGSPVRQEKWAQRLGVSRAPVREALKILVSEGLLVHDPHRGHFVAAPDVEEMRQIYLMRRLLEPELVRSLRSPDSDELGRLTTLASEAQAALAKGHGAEAAEAERRLYMEVFDLSPKRILLQEVQRLWAISEPYRTRAMSEAAANHVKPTHLRQRHQRLLTALRAADHEAIVALVLEDRQFIEQYLALQAAGRKVVMSHMAADTSDETAE
jgi:DNA-binding GntR family transcriptional regulator